MREIKFRAWNNEAEKMYYVDWFMPLVIGDESKWTIHNDANTLEPIQVATDYNSVLLQYTGLKDKNEKEIYEGDIINIAMYKQSTVLRTVEWLEVSAKFILRFVTKEVRHSWESFDEWHENDMEIVGNIYESPELLKK